MTTRIIIRYTLHKLYTKLTNFRQITADVNEIMALKYMFDEHRLDELSNIKSQIKDHYIKIQNEIQIENKA
jgi:hypothetical protein